MENVQKKHAEGRENSNYFQNSENNEGETNEKELEKYPYQYV